VVERGRVNIEGGKFMTMRVVKNLVICLTIAAFVISCGAALAAEKPAAKKAEKQWYVNKDVKGRCSVRQMKDKSPTTISGPHATKEEAEKAKADKCPKAEKPEKKAPVTPSKKTP
jgi:hypothetical protein